MKTSKKILKWFEEFGETGNLNKLSAKLLKIVNKKAKAVEESKEPIMKL